MRCAVDGANLTFKRAKMLNPRGLPFGAAHRHSHSLIMLLGHKHFFGKYIGGGAPRA